MGRKKDLSTAIRAQVVVLKKQKLSNRVVGKMLKISEKCVRDTMKRYNELGSFRTRKRCGRPTLASPRIMRTVRRIVTDNPSATCSEIKQQIRGLCPQVPSVRTINDIVSKKLNLPSRRPSRKPLINDAQRAKRLKFCKDFQHWTEQQWGRVLFSDESSFQLFGGRVTRVRRPVGERYNIKYCTPTVKKYESVMIWGCFGASGRGRLYFLPRNETINAAKYIEILTSKMLPARQFLRTPIFQQDNARPHVANIVKDYFRRNGIQVLDWPGNSPDLNPIENLWSIIKAKVRRKCPKNMVELKHAIVETWVRDISPELCLSLANSMPRRIQAVLKNKGYTTKY